MPSNNCWTVRPVPLEYKSNIDIPPLINCWTVRPSPLEYKSTIDIPALLSSCTVILPSNNCWTVRPVPLEYKSTTDMSSFMNCWTVIPFPLSNNSETVNSRNKSGMDIPISYICFGVVRVGPNDEDNPFLLTILVTYGLSTLLSDESILVARPKTVRLDDGSLFPIPNWPAPFHPDVYIFPLVSTIVVVAM